MKNYELTYLLSPDLSEQELKTLSSKIAGFIKEEGNIKEETEPIKKILGNPVKKKKEAFLTILKFQISPEKLNNLEKKLKAETKILRYLILVKKEPRPKRARLAPTAVGAAKKTAIPRKLIKPLIAPKEELATKDEEKPKKVQKVELKEIDEKIEEILKE